MWNTYHRITAPKVKRNLKKTLSPACPKSQTQLVLPKELGADAPPPSVAPAHQPPTPNRSKPTKGMETLHPHMSKEAFTQMHIQEPQAEQLDSNTAAAWVIC